VLFLSVHAVERMNERSISREEVQQALTERETVYVSPEDASATVVLGRTVVGRRLKVVVGTDDAEYVITVSERGEEV
jgi:hypothetical protein